MTEGVFSADSDGTAVFHPATDFCQDDLLAVQRKMRQRGLRWLHRHGHLDSAAVHTLDTPDHAGGWSVDGSVTLPPWDRQGLERLVRYCARPPISQERLGRVNDELLVYQLRKPTVDGRTGFYLTPLELLDRLSRLITPPRVHKHRYCGVLAPNANLRQAVIQTAGPAGATLQLLKEASGQMGLPDPSGTVNEPEHPLRRAAARCWALLLARLFECLPLRCPRCGQPMRIIAFILDPPVIDRILTHLGLPTTAPAVLPPRSPPRYEIPLDQDVNQDPGPDQGAQGPDQWPDLDQSTAPGAEFWD